MYIWCTSAAFIVTAADCSVASRLSSQHGEDPTCTCRGGECGLPFFSCSASDFVEVYVGLGASRVRQLFADARKAKPAIVFIDEIDALGGARSEAQVAALVALAAAQMTSVSKIKRVAD